MPSSSRFEEPRNPSIPQCREDVVQRRVGADRVTQRCHLSPADLAACPDDAVVCGVSAARLHKLWLPDGLSDRFEVIVNLRIAVPHPPASRVSSRRGPDGGIGRRDGLKIRCP